MKKLTTHILFICLLAVTVTACKKSPNTKTDTNTGLGAKVTASNFGFDGKGGTAFKSTTAGMLKVGPILTITAIQDGTSKAIEIVLNNVTATGTFSLDYNNTDGNGGIITKDNTKPTDAALNYSTDFSNATVKGGGQVVITKLNATEAEGTFYLTAYNGSGSAAFAEQGTFSGAVNTPK